LDPASRHFAREEETFVPPVPVGEVMAGIGIGVIEESRNGDFKSGDLVQGFLGWQEYAVSDGQGMTPLPKERPFPLTAYLAVFSHIGLAAYFGLLKIGKPQKGETIVVSAAAGGVGSLVGQIGKLHGCHVVGIVGTDEKAGWIKDELGFDAAVNYKKADVYEGLKKSCPDGIDVYFDNVGGLILDTVLRLINMKARIIQCGMISQYNDDWLTEGPRLPHLINLHFKRARLEGFICLDYPEQTPKAMSDLGGWLAEDKLKYRIEIIDGLENAPKAVNKNFDGSNRGKLIAKITEEPSE
jgi:NADPH-dependent curcumin reductase CurA